MKVTNMRKQPFILMMITSTILFISSQTSQGREVGKLAMEEKNGMIDVAIGGGKLLAGMYPVVVTIQNVYSVASGTLKIGEKVSPERGKDATGDYVEAAFTYVDSAGKEIIRLMVKLYPGLSAGAMGYKYSGGKPLRADTGFRIVIGDIPGFEKGMGAERFSQFWTRPVFEEHPNGFPPETEYILWKVKDFGYAAAIPLVGGGVKSTFMPSGGRLTLTQLSFDASFKPKGAPLLAFAWGDDPYALTRTLYRVGMDFMGNPGKLRVEKSFPEIFNYIGWCSWNAHYRNVDEEKVFRNARSFKEHNFPVKFFIIDDGWQTEKDRKLMSFDIIREKFPSGIAGFISKLKGEYGLKWVGFWHAFQGYWDGINPDSELAKKYKKFLFRSYTGALIPDPIEGRGFRFYDDYHIFLREAGADFVKVDNQSTMSGFIMNKMPIGNAMKGQQANLQKSVTKNFNNTVINCMDMTIENIYYWFDSNISRSSDDFFPGRPDNPGTHAMHNVYNSMWFSELAYPDFDMFQSHHPQAELHSVLRAVSGGPIYVTDSAGQENWDILWKLVFRDGRIARVDEPARPTSDVLFKDVSTEHVPLKAFTRVGNVGIVGAFAVNRFGTKVSGTVSPTDVYGLQGSDFAIYEHFSKTAKTAEKSASLPFSIKHNDVKLFIIVPIEDEFAAIGALNKYISPKCLSSVNVADGKIEVKLKEGCEFGAYMKKAPVSIDVDGKSLDIDKWSHKDNLLRVLLPDTDKPVKLTIYR